MTVHHDNGWSSVVHSLFAAAKTMANEDNVVLKKFSHVVAKEKNGGIAYKLKLPWPKIP